MNPGLSRFLVAVAGSIIAFAPGCSASPARAPSQSAGSVPPVWSVLDLDDTRSAPAVADPGGDPAPVRPSAARSSPARELTGTNAQRLPTAPTEPASAAPAGDEPTPMPPPEPVSPTPTTTAPDAANPTPTEPASTSDPAPAMTETSPAGTAPSPAAPTEAASSAPTTTAPTRPPRNEPELNAAESTPVGPEPLPTPPTGSAPDVTDSIPVEPTPTPPVVQVLRQEPLSLERAVEVAARLAGDIVVPNSCEPPPLGDPTLLPNAVREYRSGTHQGVDFMCPERGRAAVAALDGHVVVAVGDYENPSPADLDEVLATARRLRATPPYTLVMLYGNYVVVDHGIIDGVGHVVSIYAHLDALDAAIGVGRPVEAGQLLGWVGNSGTNTAAAGALDWSLHLHWELHVDDQYLGAGLSPSETRSVYAAVFGESTD